MKRKARSLFRDRRGIVGIEAAIVLIAFVVIAAALAYVVINMGFFSAQKVKDTINRGVSEASSALQLDGDVIGKTNGTHHLVYIVFPVKVSVGRSEVDLNANTTVVSIEGSICLLDIYKGVINESSVGLEEDPEDLDEVIAKVFTNPQTPSAYFLIYNDDNDSILENFEKAFLIINLGKYGLQEYDKLRIEVKPGQGTALTIDRSIPGGLPEDDYITLG
ncbi:flagellin [Candidatus Bathyarchaeota archaeon]|nr:flagellin [Candidatus Bathyarchaeota archaeon]